MEMDGEAVVPEGDGGYYLDDNGCIRGWTMLNTETLTLTNEILGAIAEIDEFKGAWSAMGRLAPERLEALRKVATSESIGSSTRIEGSQLSDREVDALLSGLQTASFANRDEQEVAGYADVMELVFGSDEHMAVTENVIKQLHRDLLAHSTKDARHRGAYKTAPNSVEAFDANGHTIGVVFQTATPFDTPRLMSELVQWLEGETARGTLHPLLITAVFVVVFLEIHPFQDGNGRLSRVLTALLLLRFGYSYVPYSSLESLIERNKDAYYLALRRTQQTIRTDAPNWHPWVTFFLEALQRQKQHLETKLARERTVFASLPELSLALLTVIEDHGRASVADLVRATGANRNTIKDHLRRLVAAGRFVRHGAGRGAWYGIGLPGQHVGREAGDASAPLERQVRSHIAPGSSTSDHAGSIGA